ncbi:MAG TPA: ThiF family adenylyltransferase [Candidatus Omnitrophota bacterium]|nr:ThiF family adenylyltransferase [Candidatus Omnitrophota bacterium]HPD85368.1 ThiF family adenylyltransferase [Candidatus Omnitrophota bacterium]HRZ04131.1 ThiF family adenylyltransferase [Candidatus Omnitrophota bacterium]
MFILSKRPIKNLRFDNSNADSESGALVEFKGIVRSKTQGKKVVALKYEAFEKLAQKEAEKIIREVKTKFDATDVCCIHRIGRLSPGELAVWIAVKAGRRKDAFAACRYVIDELKIRLPIWKKEYYADGTSLWVSGHPSPLTLSKEKSNEKDFYSHQIPLPQIGKDGQRKLKKARVLVVGAGGLGSSALTYLAAAGIGTIGICDDDVVAIDNLHRQPLYSIKDIGQSKAVLAAQRLRSLNPFIAIQVHQERLTPANAVRISRTYDLMVDCTDNFKAKFLLNDLAVLRKIPLIQASIYHLEGQIHFLNPTGKNACLRCLWPQIPHENCIETCAQGGTLGVVPGIFGIFQATEAIKFILGLPGLLSGEVLILDLMSYTLKKITETRNRACPLCGERATIKQIANKNYQDLNAMILDINALSVKEFRQYKLIDVREPKEIERYPVKSLTCENIPFGKFNLKTPAIGRDEKYLFFCARGMRSQVLAARLRKEGFENVFSLKGGIDILNAYITENLKDG